MAVTVDVMETQKTNLQVCLMHVFVLLHQNAHIYFYAGNHHANQNGCEVGGVNIVLGNCSDTEKKDVRTVDAEKKDVRMVDAEKKADVCKVSATERN